MTHKNIKTHIHGENFFFLCQNLDFFFHFKKVTDDKETLNYELIYDCLSRILHELYFILGGWHWVTNLD